MNNKERNPNNAEKKERRINSIFSDPKMLGGEPVIKGTRITVAVIVGSVADGMTFDEILKAFPQINEENIKDCLYYAAESAKYDLIYDLAV